MHYKQRGMGNCKIGVYVRESRDDNEENYETIETQRDLLVDFVEKNNMGKIYKIYMDDNVSGTGFERRGLDELRKDILSGNLNLLILKDLSRLGRNNAKTLMFLDFIEENGVRLITFDGKYDSEKDNEIVGIETWFNERYVRDISRKIRTNLKYKIQRGEYVGRAPYGYTKSNVEKNRLCIDEEAAEIVREIFRMYKSGYGYASIAKHLNSKGYAPPSAGKALKTTDNYACGWNAVAVGRILANRVYIGDTVQGVSEKISFKSKKTRRLPKSEWTITEATHQPIISRDDFYEVQRMVSDRRLSNKPHKGELHLFKGILYCGGCGSVMFARSRKNRPMGYICSNYGRNGRASCASHHVSEAFIESIIIHELRNICKADGIMKTVEQLLNRELTEKQDINGRLKKLEQQLMAKRKHQELLYFDRLNGKISEELFERINNNTEGIIERLKYEINDIKIAKTDRSDTGSMITQAVDRICSGGLTAEMVKAIVKGIYVFNPGDGVNIQDMSDLTEEERKTINSRGAIVIDFKFEKV